MGAGPVTESRIIDSIMVSNPELKMLVTAGFGAASGAGVESSGRSSCTVGLDEEDGTVVKNVCRTGKGTALDASGIHFTFPVRS